MSTYEVVIGIETHVQLATKTKLFCGCNNDAREAEPNSYVCPVCTGMPGALPVLNKRAVELSLQAGHALNAYEGAKEFHSKFDRKNYFYPDSPMNYQITQFDEPIVGKGYVEFPVDGETKRVGITRAHLEADAGKLTHPAGTDYSLVDLNRAGTPLLEIVSEPDMRSAAEAKAYAQELYNLMRYAGVSDANLYYGNMRFDVNVSLRPVGSKEFGTRTESKNLNSFRAVAGVVEYEMKRQAKILDKGEKIVQETRGWDENKGETFSQRSKEEAHDYRYFPEPDIPPLVITEEMLVEAKQAMPEQELSRLRARLLATTPALADKVEALIAYAVHPEVTPGVDVCAEYLAAAESADSSESINRTMALWLIGSLKPVFNELVEAGTQIILKSEYLFSAAQLVATGKLNSNSGKIVIQDSVSTGKAPEDIAKNKNLIQNSDTGALEAIVDEVIAANPGPWEQFKAGEQKVLGFLVGQVMKASKGQANPPMVNDILKKKLGS